MYRFLSIKVLLCLLILACQNQEIAEKPSNLTDSIPKRASDIPEDSWRISEKMLPIPATASEELQKILIDFPAPDAKQTRQFNVHGEEAWTNFITEVDSNTIKGLDQLKKLFPISITKDDIDGVPVQYLSPPDIAPAHKNHLFIHLHAGAYVFGGGDAGISEAIIIAATAKIPVIFIDYRMPPLFPFPAAIDDVVKVYRHLSSKFSTRQLAMGGTSAGGGLTLASIYKLKELGLELPGAVFAGTPWSDLGKTGDTQFTNEGIDHILVSYDGWLKGAAELYAGDYDLKNPLISPVYGDFKSFPPIYLVTGTRDLFLSDVVRTHRKIKLVDGIAELNVYEGMSHADYMLYPNTSESKQVYKELGQFLERYLH